MATKSNRGRKAPPLARRKLLAPAESAVAKLRRELAEARAQQAATAEIIKVIASSPDNVQPVFDAIVKSCLPLFGGMSVALFLKRGDLIDRVAFSLAPGSKDEARDMFPARLDGGGVNARTLQTGQLVQVADVMSEAGASERLRTIAQRMGFRSIMSAPLLRDREAIGTIAVFRAAPMAFSGRQVELLRTFADQAAIAIENARSFNDTREALERQTATAEILRVIASSPAEVQPVFDAIAKSAQRLIRARYANVVRRVDEMLHLVAYTVTDKAGIASLEKLFPTKLTGQAATGKAVLTGRPAWIVDVETDPAYSPTFRRRARARGWRSLLAVPMLHKGRSIGAINVTRPEPGEFSHQQVSLLQAFADQAVIAIENVRLFNETKEALERQTATAEILKVISGSPTDTQPVFEAIVQSGLKLFPNAAVVVTLPDGDRARLAAIADPDPLHAARWKKRHQFPLTREYMHAVAILDRMVIDVPDAQAYEGGPLAAGIRNFLALGNRAITIMPMQRADSVIGTISVIRRAPGPLTEKQIALLRTFADQAVIAIENVRLFNETKEALEHQTATAEVLQVISGSISDAKPVFDKILRSCNGLFPDSGVSLGLLGENHMIHVHIDPEMIDRGDGAGRRIVEAVLASHPRPARDSIYGYAMHKRQLLYYPDVQNGPGVPEGFRKSVELVGGNYSAVYAPLLWEGRGIGTLNVSRLPPAPFSDKEIRLLKTFANQAVIAIQNARLFNETKEALERQTATAEILKVIASSPSDTQPVFDVIAERAVTLCGAQDSVVLQFDGTLVRLAAQRNLTAEAGDAARAAFPCTLEANGAGVQAIRSGQVVEIADVREVPDYQLAGAAQAGGVRRMLAVPLMRGGQPIGAVVVAHAEPGRFSEHQITMVRTFADQAVIAIENVRLFNETKEALERQTATAEILAVIAGSPSDVNPVLDAIVQSAIRLVPPWNAAINMRDGDLLRLHAAASPRVADVNLSRFAEFFPIPFRPEAIEVVRAIAECRVVEVPDCQAKEATELTQKIAKVGRYRTGVAVPLIHKGIGIGAIVLSHPEPGAKLTNRQMQLISTFANQAVIAIENVRLFNETKEALERQTATTAVLRVISASPNDLAPVFAAILEHATQLCEAELGFVFMSDGQGFDPVAQCGLTAEKYAAWCAAFRPHRVPGSLSGLGRVLATKAPVLIADVADDDAYRARDPLRVLTVEAIGARTFLAVPLVKESAVIGAIVIYRLEVRPFSEKQVALLQTFADQAVIAIENVRLFKELQQHVGQLTALGEVGQAISSTLDLEKVLATIVSRAVQITGLDGGAIYEYDEAQQIFLLRGGENLRPEVLELNRNQPIRMGDGFIGRAAATRKPVQVPELRDVPPQVRSRDVLLGVGFRALLAVPLVREDHVLGALAVVRNRPGEFAPEVIALLETFATQSAIAIQNARLFREIEEKGRQLQVASQHKSQFLASMSHELRTPLNAILGFNEMLLGQIYGEVPADMQEPMQDIQKSGKHLLRLINNVLDLAKIEAGRMELALADYSVQDTVAAVHATLRPLAAEKGLEFVATVPEDIPLAHGDSGRIAQCLMNLAGNSLKFTKAGKVEIAVAEKDGLLTCRVTDTGVGIPPDKIASLFTEFKQTDATVASEYGGTGLGLSISKKFIEMHRGRIWVESKVGKGSSFIFEIPLRGLAEA